MPRVLVSYARESRTLVEALADDLEALVGPVWFDRAVRGGQAWWDEILASIRACEIFIFALTPESLDSVACRREWAYATALSRPVIPVLLDDGVAIDLLPESLARLHHVDYRLRDKESLKALSRALLACPAAVALPTPLPDLPAAPLSYLAALSERIDSEGALSFDAQSAIVLALKQGLREASKTAEVAALLMRLRARRDLFAAVADEISAVLAAPPVASAPTPVAAGPAATSSDIARRIATFLDPPKGGKPTPPKSFE
jgi:hypothetical protein